MNAAAPVVVVGIDPSLTATGIAAADGTVSCIRSDLDGMDRIGQIVDEIGHILATADDLELVTIEAPVIHAGHPTSAIELAMLAGVLRWHLWSAGVPYIDVTPAQLKIYACGTARADKIDMLQAAAKRLGYEGKSHDEADAAWLRAIGCALLNMPIVELPKTHTRALDRLWRAGTRRAVS